MRFLVTNDDGIYAPGIRKLIQALTESGTVIVVAPNQERSGVGHAITVSHPLRVREIDLFSGVEQCYMVDGTPADCVKLALEELKIEADYVISGINNGSNLGTDVLYSGTVSAAFEGVLQGIPSIAISQCDDAAYFDTATHFLKHILFKLKTPLPHDGLLNINVPALSITQVKGIRATRLGVRRIQNEFDKRFDPRGNAYYWMKGTPIYSDVTDDDDHLAIEEGYVSVTPIKFDLTFQALLAELKNSFK